MGVCRVTADVFVGSPQNVFNTRYLPDYLEHISSRPGRYSHQISTPYIVAYGHSRSTLKTLFPLGLHHIRAFRYHHSVSPFTPTSFEQPTLAIGFNTEVLYFNLGSAGFVTTSCRRRLPTSPHTTLVSTLDPGDPIDPCPHELRSKYMVQRSSSFHRIYTSHFRIIVPHPPATISMRLYIQQPNRQFLCWRNFRPQQLQAHSAHLDRSCK